MTLPPLRFEKLNPEDNCSYSVQKDFVFQRLILECFLKNIFYILIISLLVVFVSVYYEAFNDNFFDIILCYGSFSYLDLNKSFQELKRVLKPKGKLILVDSLGYNPLINYNRKRNITNYAPNYVNQLRTITHKDLKISPYISLSFKK